MATFCTGIHQSIKTVGGSNQPFCCPILSDFFFSRRFLLYLKMPPRKTPQKKSAAGGVQNGTNGKAAAAAKVAEVSRKFSCTDVLT